MSAPYIKLCKPLDEYAMLCRGCLAESGEMKNIFEWGLEDDFTQITDIQLNKTYCISALLCTMCEETLSTCARFRLQCRKSDLLLKNSAGKPMAPQLTEETHQPIQKTYQPSQKSHEAIPETSHQMETQQSTLENNQATHEINVATDEMEVAADEIIQATDEINQASNAIAQATQEILETTKSNVTTFFVHNNKLTLHIVAPDIKSKVYLQCPYCQHCCIKQKDLLLHLVRNHQIDQETFQIELRYYCSVKNCTYESSSGKNKYFLSRKFLNQHYIKVHMKKILYCEICNSSFATHSELSRHVKTCNFKYICNICEVEYSSNERLLVHLMRKHPSVHKEYKEQRKALKRKSNNKTETEVKRPKIDEKLDYNNICDSPKRSSATQTSKLEENIKNDVALPSWSSMPSKTDAYETKTDEISTQTVFEDLFSLKSQTSEDESIFFSETVSLSDIQTQTFPLEFGLCRSNKETLTSETQSPDLSIKETQTCVCLYDSPKINLKLFDSVSSSPGSLNLTSTETQTGELRSSVKSDVMLSFNSAETQTSFEEGIGKDSL